MTIELALVISIVSVAFAVFFGLKNNKRADTNDIENRAREMAEISIKLGHILTINSEIKEQLASLVRDVQMHSERLTKVEELAKRNEEALKRLHGRVDKVEHQLRDDRK